MGLSLTLELQSQTLPRPGRISLRWVLLHTSR